MDRCPHAWMQHSDSPSVNFAANGEVNAVTTPLLADIALTTTIDALIHHLHTCSEPLQASSTRTITDRTFLWPCKQCKSSCTVIVNACAVIADYGGGDYGDYGSDYGGDYGNGGDYGGGGALRAAAKHIDGLLTFTVRYFSVMCIAWLSRSPGLLRTICALIAAVCSAHEHCSSSSRMCPHARHLPGTLAGHHVPTAQASQCFALDIMSTRTPEVLWICPDLWSENRNVK